MAEEVSETPYDDQNLEVDQASSLLSISEGKALFITFFIFGTLIYPTIKQSLGPFTHKLLLMSLLTLEWNLVS